MKYLLVIPAALAGVLIGLLVFAFLPGIAFIEIWYGPESFRHPEVILYLQRPAAILGGLLGIAAAVIALRRQGSGA